MLIGGRLFKSLECIVDRAYLLAQVKELAADFLLYRIPVLNRDEHLMKDNDHKQAFSAEVCKLAVLVLGFYQRSDLAVEHSVVLGDQNDVVEIVAVLAEEVDPLHAVAVQAFAAVERYLCFVYDDNALMFAVSCLEMLLGVLHEEVRGHIQSVDHHVLALVLLLVPIDLEVCDHREISAERAVDDLGGVVALAAPGSARI